MCLAYFTVCFASLPLFSPYAAHATCLWQCTSSYLILQAYVLTVFFISSSTSSDRSGGNNVRPHTCVFRPPLLKGYNLISCIPDSEAFFDLTQRTVLHLGYLPTLTLFHHVFQLPEMLPGLKVEINLTEKDFRWISLGLSGTRRKSVTLELVHADRLLYPKTSILFSTGLLVS